MSATTTPVGITFFRGEDPLRASKLNEAFSERVWRKGDTMLGALYLWRDPQVYNEAATKQYVDGIVNTIANASVVRTFNGRQGFVQLTSGDVTTALTYTPYNATNPAGYITAAQAAGLAPVQSVAGRTGTIVLTHVDITDWVATLAPYALASSVPLPSSTLPLMDSVAAIGTGTTYARADHVHATDTTRAPITSPTFLGVPAGPTATAGTNTTQLATTAFVTTATSGSVAGVASFNTRTGAVVLTSADVTTALTFTPYNATNPAGYITSAGVPVASSTLPIMDGTATIGAGTTWARADHIHPTDTSRAAVGAIPVASSTLPIIDGTATIGVGTTWARADHIHPTDTSRVAKAGDTMTGLLTLNVTGDDPLRISVPTGNYARTIYIRPGRTWSVGQITPSGAFSISDETAAASRFYVDTAGTGTFPGTLNIGSVVATTGNITTLNGNGANFTSTVGASTYVAANGTVQINTGSATNPGVFMAEPAGGNRMILFFGNATGQSTMLDVYSNSSLALDPSANFTFTGLGAYKGGGGAWLATSDARIKDVLGEYTSGLAALLALKPVRYVYKGNDNNGDTPSMHAHVAEAKTEFIGLVAQEAEGYMPELVKSGPGFVNGLAVDDMRRLDSSPLVYALINAVRELTGRIMALEQPSVSR